MPLGYDRFDGIIPGEHGYEGIVIIDVAVHTSVTSALTVSARLQSTANWTELVYANIGDNV
ncbi:hypothetical protein IKG64_00535 [Candidatus Saccharibacteria bacterium]|nr:hypothetical protein [Candidatus Saccharibacteria bacterium]